MTEDVIAEGAKALGIALPEGAAELSVRFLDMLLAANRDFNLTAIGERDDAARLHILDSLGLIRSADLDGKRVVDIGTGGGLPGVALKIARPGANMTLLDATEKKIAFLREATAALGIPCLCVQGRAEELGGGPEYREMYDIAVSRAVARLSVLSELCLPFVRTGGMFLAMKSADSDREIDEAVAAISALGGNIERIDAYDIPGTDITRRVVAVRKVSPTPEKYPRRWAAMNKKPL